jgi:hypothetical protein
LSSEDQLLITKEIEENQKFLAIATNKLYEMENKTIELQKYLQEEEIRNDILEEQLINAKKEN